MGGRDGGREGTIEARRQEMGGMGEGEFRLLLDGAVKEEEGCTANGSQTMRRLFAIQRAKQSFVTIWPSTPERAQRGAARRPPESLA